MEVVVVEVVVEEAVVVVEEEVEVVVEVEEEVVVHKQEKEQDRFSYSGGDRLEVVVVLVEQVRLEVQVVQVVQQGLVLQVHLVVLGVQLVLGLLDRQVVPLHLVLLVDLGLVVEEVVVEEEEVVVVVEHMEEDHKVQGQMEC